MRCHLLYHPEPLLLVGGRAAVLDERVARAVARMADHRELVLVLVAREGLEQHHRRL